MIRHFVLGLCLLYGGSAQVFFNLGAPSGPVAGGTPFDWKQLLTGDFRSIGNIPIPQGWNGFNGQPREQQGTGLAIGSNAIGVNNVVNNGQSVGPTNGFTNAGDNVVITGNTVNGRRIPDFTSRPQVDDGRRSSASVNNPDGVIPDVTIRPQIDDGRRNSASVNNPDGVIPDVTTRPQIDDGRRDVNQDGAIDVNSGGTVPVTKPAPVPPGTTAPIPRKPGNVCGLSSYALVQGGEVVQHGEFPWLGGLFLTSRNIYLCTVNLVSTKHAVTAAHCFPNTVAQNYGIRWGHPRTNRQNSFANITSIDIHPGYNQSTLHDVAVMTLINPITFTLTLKPICLWRSTWSPDKDISGMVAGLGPNYEDLRKVVLPIVTQETCRGSNVFFHFATSEYTFCAGTRKSEEGPCKGDSGAGYMQWVTDRYYLRGLVSHSLSANGNCNLQEYIIFADLSKEVDWLTGIIS